MARRNTKADRILNDSAMRFEAARIRFHLAQSQLNTAKAVLDAAQEAHDALVKELAPMPRKKTEKPSASPAAHKETVSDKKVSDALCVAMVPTLDVACGEREDALIHDPKGGYASYHPFQPPPSSVVRAPRKSRTRSASIVASESSTPSTLIETETALSAGAGD